MNRIKYNELISFIEGNISNKWNNRKVRQLNKESENFEVKYGFIKLLSGTADLCEKAAEVNLQCPIAKGQVNVQKLVELPSQIPPVLPSFITCSNVF